MSLLPCLNRKFYHTVHGYSYLSPLHIVSDRDINAGFVSGFVLTEVFCLRWKPIYSDDELLLFIGLR